MVTESAVVYMEVCVLGVLVSVRSLGISIYVAVIMD